MKDQTGFYRQVGARIRDQRGKKLSQEALAAAVGLARTSISNIEKGRQRLLLHTLVDIADALNVNSASLLPNRATTVEQASALDRLVKTEGERQFIESAIGVRQDEKGVYVSQETEDKGVGRNDSFGRTDQRSSRSRLGDRSGSRSPDRS